MPLTFLTGGARSGKSTLAVELAAQSGLPVTFIATAPLPPPGSPDHDADMAERIARHRAERPSGWTTIEAPIDLDGAIGTAAGTFTVVDCLTLWVSNLMWNDCTDDEIVDRAEAAAQRCAATPDPVVVVTNEVGLGVHPDNALGRRYRDVLGTVNQRWAVHAERSFLLVAGRALRLDAPSILLDETGTTPR
jgi:adenosylcobinamide kinase / adenosylcobinamide-phosphate guanylyltransferase